jgi:hypothetical protein
MGQLQARREIVVLKESPAINPSVGEILDLRNLFDKTVTLNDSARLTELPYGGNGHDLARGKVSRANILKVSCRASLRPGPTKLHGAQIGNPYRWSAALDGPPLYVVPNSTPFLAMTGVVVVRTEVRNADAKDRRDHLLQSVL